MESHAAWTSSLHPRGLSLTSVPLNRDEPPNKPSADCWEKKKKILFSFEIKCTTPRAEGLRQWGGWDGVGGHQRARSGWEPVPLTPLPDTCAKEEASVSQRFRKGRERRAVPVFFLDLIPGGQKAEPPHLHRETHRLAEPLEIIDPPPATIHTDTQRPRQRRAHTSQR